MRFFITISIGLLFSGSVLAQEPQYNICGADFRPLYLRDSLPAGAVYRDVKKSAEDRAWDVIRRLDVDEKLMLTGGWNRFFLPPVPRLGLAPQFFADASQGIKVKPLCLVMGKTTAFPSTLALAASWDPALASEYATSIGEECRAWGAPVLLGPGVNMFRNSTGGRNFEYMGEDPLLTSRMVSSYVQGLQYTGVIATVKHFLGNEQEVARHIADSKIGERALREIYLPPYKAALDAGALAVMTGNNGVNGYPGAANTPLSRDVLRREYGFKGMIMSDWQNTMFWNDRIDLELTSGHSLLMPTNDGFGKYIRERLSTSSRAMIEKGLDTMVFYNLYPFFKAGSYDRPYMDASYMERFDQHETVALRTAEESITLLKNQGNILPIKPGAGNKILVMGTQAALRAYAGTGSGRVEGYNKIDFLQGLQEVYGADMNYDSAASDASIASASYILYFITKQGGEGSDVPFEDANFNPDLSRVAALNPRTVVIYSGGNGFPMPWLSRVRGLIFTYYSGQQGGRALAKILSGQVCPSGKLPFTLEKKFEDSPAYGFNKLKDGSYYWEGNVPGSRKLEAKQKSLEIDYKEGVMVGYRWYQQKKITPQFPFGFGLSYTSFSWGAPVLSRSGLIGSDSVTVTLRISNTGKYRGAEVVQLYVHPVQSKAARAPRELKNFARVELAPGETVNLVLQLKASDLAYWDTATHAWKIDDGAYDIIIGNSSESVKGKVRLNYLRRPSTSRK